MVQLHSPARINGSTLNRDQQLHKITGSGTRTPNIKMKLLCDMNTATQPITQTQFCISLNRDQQLHKITASGTRAPNIKMKLLCDMNTATQPITQTQF